MDNQGIGWVELSAKTSALSVGRCVGTVVIGKPRGGLESG